MSEKEKEEEKSCKVSISLDAEGKPKVELSEDCKPSLEGILEAVDKKQYETLYESISKLNDVKRDLKYNLGGTIERLPKDNPEQVSLDVVDLKFIKERTIEKIEKAQNDMLKVIDILKLSEEERAILNKLSGALSRIRGEPSSQKMKK